MKVEVEHFVFMAFNYFYIGIWSSMKLGDVVEVLPMFVHENFLDWFIFIWGREQCFKMSSEIFPRSHDYLKDLK